MPYLYETHCHCSRCSRCAISTPTEMVRAYQAAGYAGLVLTDHFIFGNTSVDPNLPWKERMQRYYDAYLEAKAAGDALDFDVLFGIEHQYGGGKEVLLYGITLAFLQENPDIPEITIDELLRRVHAAGGIAIHAHPYRDRVYIDMGKPPRADIVDGIEIYNACDRPGEDKQALELARTGDFILTSGGDIHDHADNTRIGHAGIYLPERARTERAFVEALKRKSHTFRIGGQDLTEVHVEDLP